MDLYAQNVMDHFKNPRNKGSLENPTIKHEEANYSCGDKISVDLRIENDILKEIRFDGNGCAISQAAISIMTEIILNKTVKEIMAFKEEDIVAMLGVPVGYRRKKCALLGLLTLKNAILSSRGEALLRWIDLLEVFE